MKRWTVFYAIALRVLVVLFPYVHGRDSHAAWWHLYQRRNGSGRV